MQELTARLASTFSYTEFPGYGGPTVLGKIASARGSNPLKLGDR